MKKTSLYNHLFRPTSNPTPNEQGFAVIVLVCIASIILLAYNLANKTPTIILAGNKQEVLANQFFEMATAKIRSSIHNAELHESCSSELQEDFKKYVLDLNEDRTDSDILVEFHKQDQDDDNFCPFDKDKDLKGIPTHLIEAFKIHIMHSGKSTKDDLHPARTIKITTEVTIAKTQSLRKRTLRSFTRSYRIEVMSLAQYGLTLWGSSQEQAIDMEDAKNTKLKIYSNIMVPHSSNLIYYPKNSIIDQWDYNNPQVEILARVYRINPHIELEQDTNNIDIDQDILKSIYTKGTVTRVYNGSESYEERKIRDNFPKESKQSWKKKLATAPEVGIIHIRDNGNHYTKQCKKDKEPTKLCNQSLGNCDTLDRNIHIKSLYRKFTEPQDSSKKQTKNNHSCHYVGGPSKGNRFIYSQTEDDVTIEFPEIEQNYDQESEQKSKKLFCGIITAKTLHVILPNTNDKAKYALIGIFNIQNLKIESNSPNPNQEVHIYNPMLKDRFQEFRQNFEKDNESLQCDGSKKNHDCDILKNNKFQEQIESHSLTVGRNVFRPFMKKSQYFQKIQNIENDIYQECKKRQGNKNYYTAPTLIYDAKSQNEDYQKYLEDTDKKNPSPPRKLSQMKILKKPYKQQDPLITYKKHVGSADNGPLYIISESQ